MAATKYTLSAEKRTVTGKKVRHLRKDGILPANIYGPKVKSLSIQVALNEFESIFKKAGETSLVEVSIKGDKGTRHILIEQPQVHPATDKLLHVDFHEVTLTEKMKVEIPITLTGESPASEKGIGVLIQLHNELEVEALPTELPEGIKVDITDLKEVGDEIKLSDIKIEGKYVFTAKQETVIVQINALEKEEIAEPVVPEVAEGEAGAEGTEKKEEGKSIEEDKKPEGSDKP